MIWHILGSEKLEAWRILRVLHMCLIPDAEPKRYRHASKYLPGFPDGAIQISTRVRILKKDRVFTYFVCADNYFSHQARDQSAFRMIIATLIHNGHAKPVEFRTPRLGFHTER
jgi:hypothetical protein